MSSHVVAVSILLLIAVLHVHGHGLLWDPPNRSSIWRVDPAATNTNFEDNQNFCGGFQVQWGQNEGRCGPCGDNVADPVPRKNENGGLYGQGIVGRTYKAGTNIQLQVNITASHKGYFEFNICDLRDSDPETEECFAKHPLFQLDGSLKYHITKELDIEMLHHIYVRLPRDLTCEKCVLRWHYWTGNSDGLCDDGSHQIGCGPQEVFRSCSDIIIV